MAATRTRGRPKGYTRPGSLRWLLCGMLPGQTIYLPLPNTRISGEASRAGITVETAKYIGVNTKLEAVELTRVTRRW